MTYTDFQDTLSQSQPDSDWSLPLQALWWDARGNWERAHDLVDGPSDPNSHWVHAYLHRKEGDQWNANYWYNRAEQPMPQGSLEEEHRDLVVRLSGD